MTPLEAIVAVYLLIGVLLVRAYRRQEQLADEYDDSDAPPAGPVILVLVVLLWAPLGVWAFIAGRWGST